MADEFNDYFQSETHLKIFDFVFTDTFQNAANMAVGELGDDVSRAPGLFRALSKMQAVAAASAHFYATAGLKQQGAAFFRGLADQIENGPVFAPPAEEPATPPKNTRARRKKV